MRIVPVFGLLLLLHSTALSQWVQTNGPWHGGSVCMATMGTVVFSAEESGALFRSSDSGASWTRCHDVGFDQNKIAVSRQILFVEAASGVQCSTDSGMSWKFIPANSTYPEVDAVYANDSAVFVTNPYGLFRSEDTARSWQRVLSFSSPAGFATFGTLLYELVHPDFPSGQKFGGIYRSTDNGDNWIHIDTMFANRGGGFFGVNPNLLFFIQGDGAQFRSIDSGRTWVQSSTPFKNGIYSIQSDGTTLFAATNEAGAYRSTDFGNSWLPLKGLNASSISSLQVFGKTILAGTYDDLFLSNDTGNTWMISENGIGVTVNDVATDKNIVLITTPIGAFGSSDNGSNWWAGKNLEGNNVNSLMRKDSNWFTTTWAKYVTDTYTLYKSSDHGYSWNSLIQIGAGGLWANDQGFIGIDALGASLYRLVGEHFERIDSPYTYDNVSALGLSDSLLIVDRRLDTVRQFIVSTDFGITWAHRPILDPNTYTYYFAVDGTTIFAGTPRGIYRSQDQGASWLLLNSDCHATHICIKGPIVIASSPNGVFLSFNYGKTWSTLNEGLPTLNISNVAISDSVLFAALSGGGLYWMPIPTSSTVSYHTASPSQISFYPNPAVNTITFSCSFIPASLTIFDAMGRIVAQPISPASGEITVATRNFPPGLYTARISGSGGEQVARFVRE